MAVTTGAVDKHVDISDSVKPLARMRWASLSHRVSLSNAATAAHKQDK